MLKAVAISVIIGTFLIGAYYVVDATYVQPVQQDRLTTVLSELQPGLTYDKFVSLEEGERAYLVQQMPSSMIVLLLEESKNHPSFIAEKSDDLKQSSSDQIRLIKLTSVFGLKGHESKGEAAIVASGDKVFLRLQEFGVTSGIDQHLYLTKDGTIDTGVDVGVLKASQGEQYYDITGVDTNTYNILIIYSKTFDTYYAQAKFLKTE